MLILLANTDGPPRRLNASVINACQPSTPDTAAQGQAGWGRRGASARLRVHDENDVRV